jgi:predicted nuclease of predicted toxin-antitoxin system
VKILFDHNVPKRLRQLLPNHDIATASEMGWAELGNGDLLACAEANGFEVMITGDKNLSYQQNLTGRVLALIVLDTNSWKVLRESRSRGEWQFPPR